MSELTQREKEYFAMKGALISIAKAEPTVHTAELRQIASAVLGYTRRCAVCQRHVDGMEEPVLCSPECRAVYQTWQTSPVFEKEGAA